LPPKTFAERSLALRLIHPAYWYRGVGRDFAPNPDLKSVRRLP